MKTNYAWPLLALLPGCFITIPASTPDEPTAPRGNFTKALEPLDWLVGDWREPDGTTDHWLASDGAVYGVHFLDDDQYELTIIDDTNQANDVVELSLDSHNNVKTRHTPATTIADQMVKSGKRFRSAPSPFLDTANRAASLAANARGVEGWADSFALDGEMWSEEGGWVKGRAEIIADMTPTFATTNVSWDTKKSVVAASGNLGVTWSHFQATLRTTGETVAQGNFLTVWRKQVDGSWNVVCETGRTDHNNE